jgi:hypothetical protein
MDNDKKKEQIDKAEKLADLLLDNWIKLAENGSITSTDSATIARVLMANGWTLDPTQIPQPLFDKLTSKVAFDADEQDGEARPRLVG